MHKNEFQNVMANGNEAVAWGAVSAGIRYFAHYPGSPINMVEPMLKKISATYYLDIAFNDSLNEHISVLSSAGASFCGARSLVVMKHVGLNIASDPLNYLGYTGVKGGMVIVVGTDPGANSSTGEEDTHWFAPQFNFPLFEPTSVRQIYSFVNKSYDLSEQYQLPVLIFIPGRLCYNSDILMVPGNPTRHYKKSRYCFKKNTNKYINVGARAIKNHSALLQKINYLSTKTTFIRSYFNSQAEIGLITRGITFGHAYESIKKLKIEKQIYLLNIDMVYPLNKAILSGFLKNKKIVVIIEDQDGFLEFSVKNLLFNETPCNIFGKNIFPKYGEISFEQVYGYLSKAFKAFDIDKVYEKYNKSDKDRDMMRSSIETFGNSKKCQKQHDFAGTTEKDADNTIIDEQVPERMGTFCEGCPHRASFYAIEQALEGNMGVIGGDIGCSSLPPFKADWLMCMNAGIGISQGISHISTGQTVISTGGESTFFHGGLISLQSAVLNNISMIHIVLDNRVVAMTGRQASPTTNHRVNYKKLLKSIGVKHISVVSAFKPRRFIKKLRKEMHKKGVKVIWVNTPCAQTPTSFLKLKRRIITPYIEDHLCGTCSLCYDKLGCPSIYRVNGKKIIYQIDTMRCMRCGTCRDICPNHAIKSSFKVTKGTIQFVYKTITSVFKKI